MVTKKQLAEQAAGLAGRRDADFKTPLADILLLVGQLADEAIALDYVAAQQATGERDIPGELVTTFYDLPVANDAQRGREYVVLPATPLGMPGGRGLVAVFGADGEAAPFFIQASGALGLLAGHPAGGLQGGLGCWLESGRREEAGRLWMKQATRLLYPALTVQLVVSAAEVTPNLPFRLPGRLQTRVVNLAVERLLKTAPEDAVADGRNP